VARTAEHRPRLTIPASPNPSPAALWNPRGYGNNAYAHIELSVVGATGTGVSTG
jgi:hypothetical protein